MALSNLERVGKALDLLNRGLQPAMDFTVHTTAGQAFPVTHPEAIWQPPDEEDDTVIIHVRDVGVVFTDAPGIADIVFAGRLTADSSAEGQGQ